MLKVLQTRICITACTSNMPVEQQSNIMKLLRVWEWSEANQLGSEQPLWPISENLKSLNVSVFRIRFTSKHNVGSIQESFCPMIYPHNMLKTSKLIFNLTFLSGYTGQRTCLPKIGMVLMSWNILGKCQCILCFMHRSTEMSPIIKKYLKKGTVWFYFCSHFHCVLEIDYIFHYLYRRNHFILFGRGGLFNLKTKITLSCL